MKLQRELPAEIRDNPKPYLYRAAINEALNLIRSRTRRHETDGLEDFDVAAPCTDHVNDIARDKLVEAFSQLQPATLEIMILYLAHGYTDAEIAETLGHSRSKVASILSRTRAQLQELLKGKHHVSQKD